MSIRGEVLFLGHKNAARCIGDPKQNLVNSGGIGLIGGIGQIGRISLIGLIGRIGIIGQIGRGEREKSENCVVLD